MVMDANCFGFGRRFNLFLGFAKVILFVALALPQAMAAGAPDTPFPQPVSVKYPLPPELAGSVSKLGIDRDGIVYILTSKGLARLIGDKIVLDHSYRPLAGKSFRDINVADGDLYYLLEDEAGSNRRAGKYIYKLPKVDGFPSGFSRLAINLLNEMLLADSSTNLAWLKDGKVVSVDSISQRPVQLLGHTDSFLICTPGALVKFRSGKLETLFQGENLTSVALGGAITFIGSKNGLIVLNDGASPEVLTRIPVTNITRLAFHGSTLWAATPRGVWRMTRDGSFNYFASKRWLDSDEVLDIAIDPDGNAFALTATGLNKIEFRFMTLAEKAAWYETKIRQRHIRYGFCSELRLRTPGDITTAEMIDTDNDGTWSNYYMASQAFHFGATGDEQARQNAWETFEALERLESINPIGGFPARTFERTGFKVSDPERWHERGDGIWDWKAHTSSDEIIAHTFGSAVLYETAAKSEGEKQRIASFFSKVLDHIIKNGWYLIDVDGKPTLWARWNPEYVNWFAPTIYDRRLNSAEIIAMLQFGYAITGKELYKEKAYELMDKHGYLENILLPMAKIAYTPGYKHQGIEMGNEWNHSDDLLGFVCYWTLYKYAFTDELRRKYAAAILDHWQIESAERNPMWSFVTAATGAGDTDIDGALWTLRGFPLDMIDWSVVNSHRGDITRKQPNFRHQQLEELLPPFERRITRWNSHPFVLDGGSGGRNELAGDEFLLPYWMGRYLKLIQ